MLYVHVSVCAHVEIRGQFARIRSVIWGLRDQSQIVGLTGSALAYGAIPPDEGGWGWHLVHREFACMHEGPGSIGSTMLTRRGGSHLYSQHLGRGKGRRISISWSASAIYFMANLD